MSSKNPSSLDYEALLHELALKNWRKALSALDLERAEHNARRLRSSESRFWRSLGLRHLAVVDLCRGQLARALSALAEAEHALPELGEPVRLLSAHVYIERGSAGRALETLERQIQWTPRSSYWRAVALTRLGRLEEARRALGELESSSNPLSSALAGHVKSELPPASDDTRGRQRLLEEAIALVPEAESSADRFDVTLRFALAEATADAGENERALDLFEEIRADVEALSHWPIPVVRSHYRSASLFQELGRADRARDAFEHFLSFWSDAELDRDAVERARGGV